MTRVTFQRRNLGNSGYILQRDPLDTLRLSSSLDQRDGHLYNRSPDISSGAHNYLLTFMKKTLFDSL